MEIANIKEADLSGYATKNDLNSKVDRVIYS